MERPMNQLALMATIICFTLALLGVAVSADQLDQAKSWVLVEMHDGSEVADDHHDMSEHDHHDMDVDDEQDVMNDAYIDDESVYEEMDDSEFSEYEDGDVDISEGDFEAAD